jgi:hypothetical protein
MPTAISQRRNTQVMELPPICRCELPGWARGILIGLARAEVPPRSLSHPAPGEWPEAGEDAVASLSHAVHALVRARDLEVVASELEGQGAPDPGALALGGVLVGAALRHGSSPGRPAPPHPKLRRRLERLAQGLVELSERLHPAPVRGNGAFGGSRRI